MAVVMGTNFTVCGGLAQSDIEYKILITFYKVI